VKGLKVKLLAIVVTVFGMISEGRAAPICPPLGQMFPDASELPFDPSDDYIFNKYHNFYSITEHAKDNYLSMSANERDLLQKLDLPGTDLQKRNEIFSTIEQSKVLSPAEKTHLIDLFQLNESASETNALDTYRKNYEYFFWTDHSETHLSDVLAKSKEHEQTWPEGFRKPYEEVLESPLWRARIKKAIYMHDALMSGGRAGHAEFLLRLNPKFFALGTTLDEMHYASLLAFLHSKSLIPYSDLPHWAEVLEQKSFPEIDPWKQWLKNLSADDKNKIANAAAWIRMADADRPIGTKLRNSIGDPFLTENGGVYIRHENKNYLVSAEQKKELYGAVVLNNLQVAHLKDGTFAAQFTTQLPAAELAHVQTELRTQPLLEWVRDGTWKKNTQTLKTDPETRSIAYVLCSILADFPPNSFKAIELLP
jgi:hypothetical protein